MPQTIVLRRPLSVSTVPKVGHGPTTPLTVGMYVDPRTVGWLVYWNVSTGEGDEVGSTVGGTDGTGVSATDGIGVGSSDGKGEGDVDGCGVGEAGR